MNQIKTISITLQRTDYGEADRIVTFLTPDKGKVKAVCKGVRKPKSKLAGGIELFSVSDISFIKGKGDLGTLVSSRLVRHYGDIVKDIDKTMFGYDALKIINRVLEDEGGEDFFELLDDTMRALNTKTLPLALAECSFLMRLMQLLGHEPNVTHDIKGGDLSPEDTYQFSIDDMGFFKSENGPYTRNHAKVLKLLAYNPPESIVRVQDVSKYLTDLWPLVKSMSKQYVVTF